MATFEIQCTGHTFELTLDAETERVVQGSRSGYLHGVKCPTCNTRYKLDLADLAVGTVTAVEADPSSSVSLPRAT